MGLNMAVGPTLAAALPLIALAAVAGAAEVLPASGELGCDDLKLHVCEFVDPASGLSVRLPRDWPLRRLRVRTVTGPSAGVRQRFAERWVVIDYLPEEPSSPEASLFHAAVLPRAAWLRLSAGPEPPSGVEVASSPLLAVVAAQNRSNPYPPDSRDAQIFDALIPSLEEISLIFTLRPMH
jgi:hypothetical protein